MKKAFQKARLYCFWSEGVAKYVAENCRGSYMYDSLPTLYLRAMDAGRDSVERLVTDWEGRVLRGECPE